MCIFDFIQHLLSRHARTTQENKSVAVLLSKGLRYHARANKQFTGLFASRPFESLKNKNKAQDE